MRPLGHMGLLALHPQAPQARKNEKGKLCTKRTSTERSHLMGGIELMASGIFLLRQTCGL